MKQNEWIANELIYLASQNPEKAYKLRISSNELRSSGEEKIHDSDFLWIEDQLEKLRLGLPLTPIYDSKDEFWTEIADKSYMCQRYPSLFREYDENWRPYYVDYNRVIGVDEKTKRKICHPLISKVFHKRFPIIMPYTPSRNRSTVPCEYIDEKGISIQDVYNGKTYYYKFTEHEAIEIAEWEFKELKNEDQKRPEPTADWLYTKPYCHDPELYQRINDAENALGFPLFYWQRWFIDRGETRCTGISTARILRFLLSKINDPSVHYRRLYEIGFNQTEILMIRDIYNKLNAAGIKTREIIF